VDLPLAVFEAQLDEICNHARVVDLAEGLAELGSPSRPGGKSRPRVALTFDDAYANFHEVVWPRLEERSLPATLFIPVGFIEGEAPAPIAGTGHMAPCSWSALREMVQSNRLAPGSHSWTHPDLRRTPSAELDRELVESRDHLEQQLGGAVPGFCYPRGLWNGRTERQVAAAYDYAAVGGGRPLTAGRLRPRRLYRTPIRRDAPASLERLLTAPVWLEEACADRLRRLRG
jgi:peptidoglycan/xylan/chitin deacetylase (PgdA/CDA1 family)